MPPTCDGGKVLAASPWGSQPTFSGFMADEAEVAPSELHAMSMTG